MTNELLRSLALEARALGAQVDGEEDKPVAEKKKPSLEFQITLAEYPDLIVSRIQARTTKHLVILFTAGTALIKTETVGKETTSELLTVENYCKFTANMPNLRLPNGYWAIELKKGTDFGTKLLRALGDQSIRNAMRDGYFKYYGTIEHCGKDALEYVQEAVPKLIKEYAANEKCASLIHDHTTFVADIQHRFGLQNTRDFLSAYAESLVDKRLNHYGSLSRSSYSVAPYEDVANIAYLNGHDGYYNISSIPAIKMEYKSFKDYILYDAVRFGFADCIHDFFTDWCDTLRMQYNIYGKVKDKYPENLPLLHNQLAYKTRLMKQKIDEINFSRNVERAKRYEGTCGEYLFVAPKQKQDFYDEATAQSNCLASYVGSFTEGRCIILFMRKKETPDIPYITIEVCADGVTVRQTKLARNVNPPLEIRQLIKDWVAKKATGKESAA